MFPSVKTPIDSYIQPVNPKKVKKARRRWHPDSVLLNVSIPELNPDAGKKHKKYKTTIRFKNGETGKVEKKTIWFGDPKG